MNNTTDGDDLDQIQGGASILVLSGGTPLFLVLIVSSIACIFVSLILTSNKMFEYSVQNPF